MTQKNKLVASFADAVRDIPDGSVIGFRRLCHAGRAVST